MRPINRWRHLMSSNVVVEPLSSGDGYGKPSYGSAVPYVAHFERSSKLVRNAAGVEVRSGRRVYLGSNVHVEESARVTITTGDAGSTMEHAIHPPIVAVTRRFDRLGPHHTVLNFE